MLLRLTHQFRIDPAGRPYPLPTIASASADYRAGRLDDAERQCRALIAGDKIDAEALHLLGVICNDRGDTPQALDWLTRAVSLAPDNARIHYHLGNALLAAERHAEAEARFRRVIALEPQFIDAFNNLGSALRSQQRDNEAIAAYRRALALRPGMQPALYNMGLAQARLGQMEEAVACHRAVLASPIDTPADKLVETYDALASELMELERYEEALSVSRARSALRPDDPRGEWHESLILLTLGRFREGLPKYERRWELDGFRTGADAGKPPPSVPALREFAGRHVLLRAEQGRGDVLQFVRYAALVAREAAHVTLMVPADLTVLMQSTPGIDAVIDDAAPEPEHDLSASLLSLPLTFGTEPASIPAKVPYLRAPDDRIALWRQRLGPAARPRVGVCWWGLQHIPERSIPTHRLAPLLAVEGIEFHAVQKEITETDRRWAQTEGVVLHDAALADFTDTAALLAHMDLVVAIDTSVAHLAGALGRPTWIMLRRNADWRWFTGRANTPWYPTARLFRQTAASDWDAVVETVRQELKIWVGGPHSVRFANRPLPQCGRG